MKAATNTSMVMLAPKATVQAKVAARVSVMPGPRPPHQLMARSSSAHNANPLPPTRFTEPPNKEEEAERAVALHLQASWPLSTYYIHSVVSFCGKARSLGLHGPIGPWRQSQ